MTLRHQLSALTAIALVAYHRPAAAQSPTTEAPATEVSATQAPATETPATETAADKPTVHDPAKAEVIQVNLAVDVPVTVAAFAVGGTLQLLGDELVQQRCAPGCLAGRVNALDATTLGRYSDSAHQAGNAVIATSLALPLALGAVQVATGAASWEHYGQDMLIVGETIGVTVMLHQIVTFTSQRPRPYAYNGQLSDEQRQAPNAYLSFYSGHTANAFAVASAYSYLYTRRNGSGPQTFAIWTLGYGLAALQGYLRVAAGYHYWSDVLVGAAVGTATGLVIPWLHTHDAADDLPPIALTAIPVPGGASVGMTGSW